jgi:hypothetical protein
MAKISFTLKGISKEIIKAEKKLRSIRGSVTADDQHKIDLNLQGLEKCQGIVKNFCRPPTTHFGQTFTTKTKAKAGAK